MIDILIPMYGRGEKAQEIVDNIHAVTEVEHRIMFLCSSDDVSGFCFATGEDTKVVSWPCGPSDYAMKINEGLRITHHPFVFTGASDLEFTRGWDTEALKVAEAGFGVVGTQDDANPLVKRGKHSTHSLILRAHAETVGCTFHDGPGVIYSEAYKHQYVDTELVRCAIDTGQWAFARRSVVRHLHPFYHKQTPMDDTYRIALADSAEDAAIYRMRLNKWSASKR
jgi:hypothetical protein